MLCISIPLSLIFAVQCALVIGSFVAVILVLTEQQRTEFQDALYTRLRMQQSKALQQVYAPLDTRAQLYTAFTNYYNRQPGPQYPQPQPNMTLQAAAPFQRHFAHLMRQDPLLRTASIANLSDIRVPHDMNRFYLNVMSLKAVFFGVGWNGTALRCFGSVDAQDPATCRTSIIAFDTEVLGTAIGTYTDPEGAHVWAAPFLAREPGLTEYELQMAFRIILSKRPGVGNEAMAVFSVDIRHMLPVVRSAVASNASTAALFSRNMRYLTRTSGTEGSLLISTTAPIPEQRIAISPSDGTFSRETYTGGQTPDADLNTVFAAAEERCYAGISIARARPPSPDVVSPPQTWATGGVRGNFTPYSRAVVNPCAEPQVFEAQGFVVAAARQATDDYLDLMLLQYTPRAHFFGASDEARLQGVLIGVGAGLVVVVSSVLILAAVWVPMRALQRGMDLAAEMRNDEVPALRPVLTELSRLAGAFAEMNERLLLARPFLPQSLLVRSRMNSAKDFEEDDQEAEEDEEAAQTSDDEGSIRLCTSHRGSAVSVASHRLACSPKSSRALSDASSSRSNASRSTQQPSPDGGSVSRPAGIGSALNTRRVGILVANVRGFHAGTQGMVGGQVVAVHRRLAECVEQCVGRERGIVDAFHGDRFVAAFNTARPCGVPAKLGALAALGLERAFGGDAELRAAFPLGLSMGLSCGRALVGNMGTATMQRLSTVGAAYSEAAGLQEVMARGVLRRGAVPVAGRCLFSGKALPELEGNVRYQVVGCVGAGRLAGSSAGAGDGGAKRLAAFAAAENSAFVAHLLNDAPATAPAEPHGPSPTEPVVVVAVLHQAVSSDGPGEWLYSLQAAKEGDTFRPMNMMLCALLLRGVSLETTTPDEVGEEGPSSAADDEHRRCSAPVTIVGVTAAAAALQAIAQNADGSALRQCAMITFFSEC